MRKFKKKNKKLINVIKITAIWYLFFGMAAYLTGNTNAYFIDDSKVSGQITAGVWLPSLKITATGYSDDGKGIYAKVENAGAAMESTGSYQILKANEAVYEGSIDLLSEGGSTTITFEASESGSYQFRISAPGSEDSLSELLEITIEEQEEPKEVVDEKVEDPPAEEIKDGEESTEDKVQPEPPANKDDPKQPAPPADIGGKGDGNTVTPPAEETKEQKPEQPSEPVQPPVEEPPSEQNSEKTIEQAGD
ncbi:hypothetical protein [Bacillus mesophilum]|uniref:Amyloid fiber anchoring/assembly protein TapA n=1 Tax=Bacillus mesophilum TaxID=1071718 RepID=A0A7V7RKP7_9BACI|nr:hypothetical protein [Bacillus mesophilum]KAB2331917.1 hypothetical protein F7732_14730 [Bacillus mesophilum]